MAKLLLLSCFHLLSGKSSGPGAQNAAGSEEFFPDLDQVPDYDHEDLMQGHQKNSNLFLLPLREVEGNHSSEANDATHGMYPVVFSCWGFLCVGVSFSVGFVLRNVRYCTSDVCYKL